MALEPRLPLDILALVLDSLVASVAPPEFVNRALSPKVGRARRSAGVGLATVCRFVLPWARRILYSSLDQPTHDSYPSFLNSSAVSLAWLARHLLAHTHLGSVVQTVHFQCRSEANLLSGKAGEQDFHVINALDVACPETQTLHLYAAGAATVAPSRVDVPTSLSQVLQFLVLPFSTLRSRLTHLTVVGDAPPQPNAFHNVDIGPALQHCTSLRSLHATNVTFELADMPRLAALSWVVLDKCVAFSPREPNPFRVNQFPFLPDEGLFLSRFEYHKTPNPWIGRDTRTPFLAIQPHHWCARPDPQAEDACFWALTFLFDVFGTLATLFMRVCNGSPPVSPNGWFRPELYRAMPASVSTLGILGDVISSDEKLEALSEWIAGDDEEGEGEGGDKIKAKRALEMVILRWESGQGGQRALDKLARACEEAGVALSAGSWWVWEAQDGEEDGYSDSSGGSGTFDAGEEHSEVSDVRIGPWSDW